MVILDLLLLRCSLVKEIWYNTIVNLIGILKTGLISSIGLLKACFDGDVGSSSASMFSAERNLVEYHQFNWNS